MNQKITYTKKEIKIIIAEQPMKITDEEFLIIVHKAYDLDDIISIIHMYNIYPEIMDRVFSAEFIEKHSDPADSEERYHHPILCPTNKQRYTEGRIKDMVCYLIGDSGWNDMLFHQLQTKVPFKPFFNYLFDEYVNDYNADILWNSFFLGQKELSQVIEKRNIVDMLMLEYRTIEYYERSEKRKHNKTIKGQIKKIPCNNKNKFRFKLVPGLQYFTNNEV